QGWFLDQQRNVLVPVRKQSRVPGAVESKRLAQRTGLGRCLHGKGAEQHLVRLSRERPVLAIPRALRDVQLPDESREQNACVDRVVEPWRAKPEGLDEVQRL